uniref:ATP synthase subunit a n=1 Tax=Brachycentrus subnubilus TaxID=446424 RepID=A0A7D6W8K1_9NEOP|nr:ATP synthase F0 subunit 6 [Brachycentrus subnubilus]
MMTNLFSIFDPSTKIFSMPLNWLSTLIGLMVIPMFYWLIPSRFTIFLNSIFKTLHNEFKVLIGNNYHFGTTFIFITLFYFIICNNFLGLFPYIYNSTSHMMMNLSIALPMWLSFMIFGWLNNTQHMFTHLVPQGTPSMLMSFMVLIETISNVIRPMTLAVRLMANMIAGHLLITLLSSMNLNSKLMLSNVLILIMILLLMLETAVSFIQAYVFTILSTLYSSEVI